MTFKYLYCCDGAESYMEKFRFCHMPLDSYTLDWYCDMMIEMHRREPDEYPRFTKSRITDNGWSRLKRGSEAEFYI